ncbi:probable G-protein coupled receptor 139 [Heterodontus francisci]|uniref:probable G-protein coupled receptor 139 n=1 Tax=Heterodontus francisci TaxID=7792 RepID=UPI00355BBB69
MEYPVMPHGERIVYHALAVFGVLVNLMAIVILFLGKCGRSKCSSCYMVRMAAADLLVVISEPILYRTGQIYFPVSFLFITPMYSFLYFLMITTTMISVWLTVAFTFDRFLVICCEKLKAKYFTEKTAAVVFRSVSVLGCLVFVPWYFRFEPEYKSDNVPWYCITKPVFFTATVWDGNVIICIILVSCVPFFLILFLNVLTTRSILAASRGRRGLRGCSNGEKQKDPEMEIRRKSIILLFSISASFMLLWVTRVVFYIYQRIIKMFSYPVTDPLYVTEVTANMLQLLSTCTNTCIYVLTQKKFRDELKNAVSYPLNQIVKIVKS